MKRTEGVVVRVLSPSRLVIDLGGDDGVLEGRSFLVFQHGEPIRHPSTGEDLGALEVVKGIGRAIHVQPKISTIESKARRTVTLVMGAPPFLRPYGEQTEPEPFDDPKIGDLVRPLFP